MFPFPYLFYIRRPYPATDTPSAPAGKTSLTHFSSAFFRRMRHVMRAHGLEGMELHDIAAVWAAIAHPPGLEGTAPGWTVRRRRFEMERCVISYYLA